MSEVNTLLMNGWRQNRQQLEALLTDVSTDGMTRQPHGVVNHPAWTIAHLIHYHPAILSLLRGEVVDDPATATDADLYDAGSTPVHDSSLYPDRQTLLERYCNHHEQVIELLAGVESATFDRPPGLPRWAEAFGTTDCALVYLMHVHEAMHIGQIMVWRRAMGWPPLE